MAGMGRRQESLGACSQSQQGSLCPVWGGAPLVLDTTDRYNNHVLGARWGHPLPILVPSSLVGLSFPGGLDSRAKVTPRRKRLSSTESERCSHTLPLSSRTLVYGSPARVAPPWAVEIALTD